MIEAKVPVIDYSVTDSQLSSELYKALTTVGFACLTNTGLWDKVKNLRSQISNLIIALKNTKHLWPYYDYVYDDSTEFFCRFCFEVYYCKLVNISFQEDYTTSSYVIYGDLLHYGHFQTYSHLVMYLRVQNTVRQRESSLPSRHQRRRDTRGLQRVKASEDGTASVGNSKQES